MAELTSELSAFELYAAWSGISKDPKKLIMGPPLLFETQIRHSHSRVPQVVAKKSGPPLFVWRRLIYKGVSGTRRIRKTT
jgi:hypothetical protein